MRIQWIGIYSEKDKIGFLSYKYEIDSQTYEVEVKK